MASREKRGRHELQVENHREKAMRSIFVANISFETSEDQLKAVLTEVGPVVSLKLIQDSTGKPRGFGFCEYEDAETAMSACRNLAGREVNGRQLRIDSAMNAPGESTKSSNINNISSAPLTGPVEPPVHGPPISPENAPEAITKAVASLPPEQMFELMKQMKWCIQHNPNETRQLLLHNPQLSYALLQAQVVMKIVDLETAQKLLHRTLRGQPLQSDPHLPPPPPPPPTNREPPPPHQRPPPGRLMRPPPPGGGRGGGRGRGGWFGGEHPHSNRGPPPSHHGVRPHLDPRPQSHRMSPRGGPDFSHRPPLSGPPDSGGPPEEENSLIMQVLSLTDEQIQMLPADQRNNILRLKEQIAHNNRP